MRGGYIKLWRRIVSSRHWPSGEFTKFEAWIDMILLLASGINGEHVERGSFLASQRFLAKRWGWSQSRVKRFLHDCQDKGEIELTQEETHLVTQRLTRVTICKYEHFNPLSNHKENREVTQKMTQIKEKNKERINKGERWATVLTDEWNTHDSLTTHNSKSILRRTIDAVIKRSSDDRLTLTELKKSIGIWAKVRDDEELWSMPWELPEFLARRDGYWVRACLDRQWRQHFKKYGKPKEKEKLKNWDVGKHQDSDSWEERLAARLKWDNEKEI